MSLFGAVELGGTKTLAALGNGPEDLADPLRIPTGDPASTLEAVVDFLGAQAPAAVGIACFGPVELRREHPDYGSITATPKPGWSGAPVHSVLSDRLGVPVGFDTDVNGAALGEAEWGAARGLTDFIYMTVGTGIGGGVVAGGEVVGKIGHSEVGHVVVRRHDGDTYPGGCPFHRDCLEGMANGPALEERFGPAATRESQEEVLELASFYLAQGIRDLVYVLAPQRVVVGGGVSHIPGFHAALLRALSVELGGYPGLPEHTAEDYVVAPGLGDRSGLAGGLVLARRALLGT